VPSSRLLRKLFSVAWAEECLDDAARLQGMLDFEAGLARAEARIGLVPADAAEKIARKCRAALFDLDRLADAAARAGNPAIPMVSALTALVAAEDGTWLERRSGDDPDAVARELAGFVVA
jgi:3-carboxy-cis,cis-muconate cycloisomerase